MNSTWAYNEFKTLDRGDQRLNNRLVKLSDDFVNSPQSPINQSCQDWAATKAAYRFFQNESISYKDITQSHVNSTVQRCNEYPKVLAIQDSTYFTYISRNNVCCTMVIAKQPMNDAQVYDVGIFGHLSNGQLGVYDKNNWHGNLMAEPLNKWVRHRIEFDQFARTFKYYVTVDDVEYLLLADGQARSAIPGEGDTYFSTNPFTDNQYYLDDFSITAHVPTPTVTPTPAPTSISNGVMNWRDTYE